MITRINSRMDELCSRSALSLSQREKETDATRRDGVSQETRSDRPERPEKKTRKPRAQKGGT